MNTEEVLIMRTQRLIEFENVPQNAGARKRVAAYVRVSMDTERLRHSFAQQVSYYDDLIRNHPNWEYAGIYADEFVSGTGTEKRTEFRRLVEDCDAGKIDMILVKSISRFARNTVDLLNTVRYLKELGIEVRFEEQNINSLSGEGELMLTLLASFAQAESESISENLKWAIRKGFEQGRPNTHRRMLGYRWEEGRLVVVPEEAEVIRKIFADFLDGKSRRQCSCELKEQGYTTICGNDILAGSISFILTNPVYTGGMLLQKTFVKDPFSRKKCFNKGELPRYFVKESHEAIIDREMFVQVQERLDDNRRKGAFPYNRKGERYPFSGKIVCGKCGRNYRRQLWKNGDRERPTWSCSRKNNVDLEGCDSQNITEMKLIEVTAEVLGLERFEETAFLERIEKIVVDGRHNLIYCFKDGKVVNQFWQKDGLKKCFDDPAFRLEREQRLVRARASRKGVSPFTGRIICECCGRNYRKQTRMVSGKKEAIWLCGANGDCDNGFILNSRVEEFLNEVLGTAEFDREIYEAGVDYMGMPGSGFLNIYLKNGAVIERRFSPIRQEMRQRAFQKKTRKKVREKVRRKGENSDGSRL